MATFSSTPSRRGGERTPALYAQIGPVTRALRVMLAADPEWQRIRDLRRRIADRIEADIALLDALDGDTDQEADYPTTERAADGSLYTLGRSSDDDEEHDDREPSEDPEPSLGSLCGTAAGIDMPQTEWDRGSPFENEEEHDGREDDELGDEDGAVPPAEFAAWQTTLDRQAEGGR